MGADDVDVRKLVKGRTGTKTVSSNEILNTDWVKGCKYIRRLDRALFLCYDETDFSFRLHFAPLPDGCAYKTIQLTTNVAAMGKFMGECLAAPTSPKTT